MKWLWLIICLVLASCSENPTISDSIECNCGLEIYTDELTYINSLSPYYELELYKRFSSELALCLREINSSLSS